MYLKLIIPLLLLSNIGLAQQSLKSSDIREKKYFGNIRAGLSEIETKLDNEESKKTLMIDLELVGRYAFSDSWGVNFSIGKWTGNNELSSQTGGLAYHVGGGILYSLTGSLIDKTEISTQVVKNKTMKDGKLFFVTKLEKKTVRNKFNGIRIGAYATEYSFSKLDRSVLGWGGTAFYEHRLNTTNLFMQYGVKGDSMSDAKMDGLLFQGFISIGF